MGLDWETGMGGPGISGLGGPGWGPRMGGGPGRKKENNIRP